MSYVSFAGFLEQLGLILSRDLALCEVLSIRCRHGDDCCASRPARQVIIALHSFTQVPCKRSKKRLEKRSSVAIPDAGNLAWIVRTLVDTGNICQHAHAPKPLLQADTNLQIDRNNISSKAVSKPSWQY